MRKLKLYKYKIAAINTPNLLLGGSENSNAITICEETGEVSVTCHTNSCDEQTNQPASCNQTNPGDSRPNSSIKLSATCPGLG
ncbi:hypothetical protein [uncultured Kordia sp.]|uniref:hypothetical protein n=1 Tax=uncultured Kordia sp. TaxID=507699 RepID=UPI00261E7BEB|nr:hypothetical protein [uncultured Kordia sp.]